MKKNRVTILSLFVAVQILSSTGQAKESYRSTDPCDVGRQTLSFYERSFTAEKLPHRPGGSPRNVILCIGDGMGFGQVTLTRLQTMGPEGRLHMERFPVQGMAWTHAADNLVTDSAAAGTALACGIKTTNKAIGQDPEGTAYMSLTEGAHLRHMRTGLIATSALTHATPGSFAAHVKQRKQENDIAVQLVDSGINVLFGGGRQFFLPTHHPEGKREDGRDLIAQAQTSGYHYVSTPQELWGAQGTHVLGLFQAEALNTELPEPTLAELTRKAIRLLTTPPPGTPGHKQGFFLMIEGSQIDWACHANHVNNTVRQTLLFDQAVRTAMDFALRDQQTLVLVTADHETGGLVVASEKDGKTPQVHWASKGHSAMPVPIYALGPGAEHFGGSLDNTDIPKNIARLLGMPAFPRMLDKPTDTPVPVAASTAP
jgi:alkaline phosphatase